MGSNIESVQAIYAAFGSGDIGAILGRLAPEVEWEHDGVDHGMPWLKPVRGREAVSQFFQSLAAFEFRRFEPQRFLADATSVVAVIQIELLHKASGRTIRDLELHFWSFDFTGQVTRFKHLVDTHQHWLAWRDAKRE